MSSQPIAEGRALLSLAKRYLDEHLFSQFLPEDCSFELLDQRHSLDVVRWRSDPENCHAFFRARALTLEDQARFLSIYESLDRVDLVLVAEASRRPLGVFSLKGVHTTPELGKLLGERACRGKGLATSATRAVLHFGFEWLQLETIWAHTRKDNAPNIRVNEKLGFAIESTLANEGVEFWRMSLPRERFLRGEQ